jgi:glycosyltransferase involved in cell wall biosynthesis
MTVQDEGIMLNNITPVLLTYNEASNIKRALAGLGWAKQLVVVDSGSTDGTLDVLSADTRVQLFHRTFDGHFAQWTYAVSQTGISTRWILRLDADYQLSDDFVQELSKLDPPPDVNAYSVGFCYAVLGRKLPTSLYPPKPVLLRLGGFAVTDCGHTEGWAVHGVTARLNNTLVHDDWKSMDAWVLSQARYMRRELTKLQSQPRGPRNWLRLHPPLMPFAVFFFCLFGKRLIFAGRAGVLYTLQRVVAEAILALMLLDKKLRAGHVNMSGRPAFGLGADDGKKEETKSGAVSELK